MVYMSVCEMSLKDKLGISVWSRSMVTHGRLLLKQFKCDFVWDFFVCVFNICSVRKAKSLKLLTFNIQKEMKEKIWIGSRYCII